MRGLALLVVGALVAAGAYAALAPGVPFPRPISLAGYEQGQGVVFAPAGAHYSIRFTAAPRVVRAVAHAQGYDISTRSAVVSTDDYDLVLREDVVSFPGKNRTAARASEVRLSQPTMQRALATELRAANITHPHVVDATVDGYPALVYRSKPTPLNGSVAAATIYARGAVLTLLVHTDADGDAALRAFEKSLRFRAH